MAELSKIFRRYGIKIVAGKAPRGARKQAEEALAHAINDLKFRRENLLLKHDAEVIGKLSQLAIEQAQASVLCTWDRMHFYVHEKGAASFDVMDPAALGDMMSLALATDTETSLLGPMVVAMQLSDGRATQLARSSPTSSIDTQGFVPGEDGARPSRRAGAEGRGGRPHPIAHVQVIGLSDWHAQLDPTGVPTKGGAAVLSALFAAERASVPNTIIVSAGDSFGRRTLRTLPSSSCRARSAR